MTIQNKNLDYSEPVISFTIGNIRDRFNEYFKDGILGDNPWDGLSAERRDDILDKFQWEFDLSEEFAIAAEYVFEGWNQ